MHERLTWNPFDPAPYESAWSVFGKLLALNFCKPADITNAISRQECTDSKYLVFRDCNWIDFDRFSDLIGVAPNRLRAGFLQQLGFPQFSYRDGAHGIRFCPECLKFGYHSILFDLALVTECPIHQKPLQKGCTVCCNAIARTGLVREISPHQINGGVIHDSAWRADTYVSKCGHIYFDPERVLGIRRFDFNQRREMSRACEELIRWWRKAFTSTNAAPGLIARLAQTSFKDQDVNALSLSMDIARRVAGECPWPTSISPSPASWVTLRRSQTDVGDGRFPIEFKSDLGKIYRSVRRHIFKKYIRPSHLICWREITAYELEMSRAISSHTACVMVLAYMSWRMSIEGFSNIEGFGLKKPHNPNIFSFDFVGNTATELANFWYAQFFAIFGRIEQMLKAGGHFYIERSSGEARFVGCAEYVPNIEQGTDGGTWYILFPNKDRATKVAAKRCIGIKRGSKSMLNVSAANQVYRWGWNGYYSNDNRPTLLFRIKDDSRFGQAYAYLCV